MNGETKDSVARFIIDQVCDCPHCQRQFSIIATIRAGGLKPKQMTVTQAVHEKADINTPKKEITVNIPRPPYFGALMQFTKFEPGNEEFISCPFCDGNIRVPECDWDYSIGISNDTSNKLIRLFRRLFPYKAHPERCKNHDSED